MNEDDVSPPPPPGYGDAGPSGPFLTENGPLFLKFEEGPFTEQCFFVRKRHVNTKGMLHGGMIATFMDSVLARTVLAGAEGQFVTVHLATSFLAVAKQGEWVYGEGRVVRATPDLIFADARAYVDSKDIARATGIFKVLRRRA